MKVKHPWPRSYGVLLFQYMDFIPPHEKVDETMQCVCVVLLEDSMTTQCYILDRLQWKEAWHWGRGMTTNHSSQSLGL